MSKTCLICKEEKLLDKFRYRKDYQCYEGYCRYCKNKKKKEYDQKNWPTRMITDSKKKDKKNFGDKTTTVTKEYILNQHKLQNNKCYYCDCEMEYGIGVNRFHNPVAITLERISNKLPHTNSNCVLICWDCNMMKNSTEFKDFIEKCTYISNKFKYVFD
jgi:hypothetical protein